MFAARRALLLLFVLVVLCSRFTRGEDDEESAKVLLYKSTTTAPVVEGRDFFVTYLLVNKGDATATNIEVHDRFDPKSFEMLRNIKENGSVYFNVAELAPKGKISLNVTVVPKLTGTYTSTTARIKYNTGISTISDTGRVESTRSGTSTSMGKVKIISVADFGKKSKTSMPQWIFISLCVVATISYPAMMWHTTHIEANKATGSKKSA